MEILLLVAVLVLSLMAGACDSRTAARHSLASISAALYIMLLILWQQHRNWPLMTNHDFSLNQPFFDNMFSWAVLLAAFYVGGLALGHIDEKVSKKRDKPAL